MIGQNNILNKLKSYTLSSLPHSILLIGEKGSEQYDMCKEVSSAHTKIINLSDTSLDSILDLSSCISIVLIITLIYIKIN